MLGAWRETWGIFRAASGANETLTPRIGEGLCQLNCRGCPLAVYGIGQIINRSSAPCQMKQVGWSNAAGHRGSAVEQVSLMPGDRGVRWQRAASNCVNFVILFRQGLQAMTSNKARGAGNQYSFHGAKFG